MRNKKKVFLAEWRPLHRFAIQRMLSETPDLEMTGWSVDTGISCEKILQHRPDVVLTALFIRDLSGFQLVRKLRKAAPQLPVIVMSVSEDPCYLRLALEAGAQGYLLASREEPDGILRAVRAVLRGERYVSPGASEASRNAPEPGGKDPGNYRNLLSSREIQVFHMIGNGNSTQEIADSLNLSPKTVLAHKARIQKKLNLKKSTQLIQRAVQWICRQGVQ